MTIKRQVFPNLCKSGSPCGVEYIPVGLSIGLSAELLLYIVLWTCDSTKPWFSPCHQDKREGLEERKTERKEERKKRENEEDLE